MAQKAGERLGFTQPPLSVERPRTTFPSLSTFVFLDIEKTNSNRVKYKKEEEGKEEEEEENEKEMKEGILFKIKETRKLPGE